MHGPMKVKFMLSLLAFGSNNIESIKVQSNN